MHHELSGTTFCIQTFGCQMNKHDSERVAGMLEALGSLQVDTVEESDITVFITCCVREKADTRLYGQVASMKNIPLRSHSPFDKRIVAVGGCIGQRDGASLQNSLPHIDIVFGTHNISALPSLLHDVLEDGSKISQIIEESEEFANELPQKREFKWQGWLPISTGCNNFCTYCIVPYVRGRERSLPLEEIAREAQALVDDGVKEITLLGQNVNSYGRDLYEEACFEKVLDAVNATGVERLRFVTSHPKDLSDSIIERFSSMDSLMPALHLPAQSGSDRILKEMNRRYTREHYLELVKKLREAVPGIALSTDIIVGFPGETDEDFEDTYSLVEEVGYSQAFTFIYSPRKGTPAAKMENTVPEDVIQERFERLVDLVQKKAYEFNLGENNKTLDVLIEGISKRNGSMLSGKSPKNQTVHAEVPAGSIAEDLLGNIVKVHITNTKTWYLQGELV